MCYSSDFSSLVYNSLSPYLDVLKSFSFQLYEYDVSRHFNFSIGCFLFTCFFFFNPVCVCWDSWLCCLLNFINFWKSLAFLSLNISSTLFSQSETLNYIYVYTIWCLFTSYIHYQYFFLFFSFNNFYLPIFKFTDDFLSSIQPADSFFEGNIYLWC